MLAVIKLRIFTSITNYNHLSHIFCYIAVYALVGNKIYVFLALSLQIIISFESAFKKNCVYCLFKIDMIYLDLSFIRYSL